MNAEQKAIQALRRQRQLLEIEYNEEKETFRRQTETIGLRRKIKRGDAWWPLRVGNCRYNSLNQLTLEVYRTADTDVEHNFEYGRPVVFFRVMEDNKIVYFQGTATVSYADGDRMVVALQGNGRVTELQAAEHLGVQLFFDETSYKAMFNALDRVIAARDNRLAYLRNLFVSDKKPDSYTFDNISMPWLNPTQEEAVNSVLRAKDVAIVHGPPGTGKTTTLVEAIYETLKRESQVLVCAQSNMAVDWISEKLVDRGVNVLRIGNPSKVNDKMLSFTYERRFEAHPDYPQLWRIRKAMRDLRETRGGRRDDKWHQKMDRLKSRAAEIEIRINAELFGEARVISSTLVGCSNRLFEGQRFNTLFIDEAAQALEAACWIPMRRVSRVILAGDHCQLPPTVKSIEAMQGGLGLTMMERIAKHKPEVVTLLRMQYRMNEHIMRFSSEWFYGGMVESSPTVKHRGILDYDMPMVWMDTSSLIGNPEYVIDNGDSENLNTGVMSCRESFVGESFGRINKVEALLTLSVLKNYFMKIGRERVMEDSIDVGVISPYRAQVQYLRGMIKKDAWFKPYRQLITVNTVDGFQGQERDVIIISLVRSNEDGQIGFLRDLRRMNVAITRARMKLIIMGDKDTMSRHPFYKKLYEYTQAD